MNWERCSGHRREARGERRDAGDTDKAPGEGDLARNVQKPEGKGENPRRFSPVSASGSWSRGSYCIVPGLDGVEEVDHPRRSSLRVDEFAAPDGSSSNLLLRFAERPPLASRLSPPASRLPPLASRLSPLASRLSPPASRLPPLASRLSPLAYPWSPAPERYNPRTRPR